VVTEQSVKSAARHASEYFRKTNTNAPAATSRYSSGSRESRGITGGKKKGLLRLRGAESLRRKIRATTREILPAEIAQVSRDVRRRDPREARSLFLSSFRRLCLPLSPPPISTRYCSTSNFKRARKWSFSVSFRVWNFRATNKIARRSKFLQVRSDGGKQAAFTFCFFLTLDIHDDYPKRRRLFHQAPRLVHRVSFEFTSRDALMTAIFISRSFSTRSISWNPEPGRIHFSLTGFAADSRNRNADTCEQRVTNTHCGVLLPHSRSSE